MRTKESDRILIMAKKVTNRISERAAVELLKRLYSLNSDKDSLSLLEVYAAAGRTEEDSEANRNWLNTVMAKLKDHTLIEPVYVYDGRKKLNAIKLTMAGTAALGRGVSRGPLARAETGITYNDLAKDVAKFRNENPDFEVVFSVSLKEVPSR